MVLSVSVCRFLNNQALLAGASVHVQPSGAWKGEPARFEANTYSSSSM